jgi:PhnB protein
MAVKPVPDGYHTITPYVSCEGAAKFIDFLKQAFEATVKVRMDMPGGKVAHAEVQLGDSILMVGEAGAENKAQSVGVYLYVPDVDATHRRALAAGATSVAEPANQFYGDRNSRVRDAWGNTWGIATHVEDVPPEEMQKRAEEALKKAASA